MAVKINGTNNTIDMGGGSLVNNSNINGLIVPDESGSFITSERDDSHISIPTSLHLLTGDVSVTDEVNVNGINVNVFTGSGAIRNITTDVDIDTQWGNDTSKRYGGLILIKSKSAVGNWTFVDTVRGVNNIISPTLAAAQTTDANSVNNFNSSGYGLGTSTTVNASATNYLSIVLQTTHRRTGLTNHGQSIEEHYNPYTGFFIIKYVGSGSVNHFINHSLGRKISFAMIKNTGTVDAWTSVGSKLGNGNFFIVPGQGTMGLTTTIKIEDNFINLNTATGSDTNANGGNYVMYGFSDAYKDRSNKLIGNFETGIYVGTGAVRNVIKTKGKPLFVLTKQLDSSTTNDFTLVDIIRGGGKQLSINLNSIEDATNTMTIYKEGFSPTGNTGTNNALGVKHFYLVVYDNDNSSGKSKYIKTADTSLAKVSNGLVGITSGYDTNGIKNKIISKDESINSLNLKPGKNYVYCKNTGVVESTPYAPCVDVFDGFGEFLNSDTKKWYKNLSVFKDDFTNGIGTWIADEFYGNANIATLSVINNELKIANNGAYYGTARNTFPTTIGKKYKFSVKFSGTNLGIVGCYIGTSIKGSDLYAYDAYTAGINTTYTFTGTFTATTIMSHITLYNINTAGQISTWDNIYIFPITVDDIVEVSSSNEITEGRTYFNTMIYCDHNGKIVYEEELPKTQYLNSTVINNLESVKGNAVTNSTTDNTLGKLLRVGDFGIGGSGVYKQDINLNQLKDTGWYYVNGNCLNNPTGANGWLQVVGVFGTGMMQIFTQATAGASDRNRVFVRSYTNLNYFSPWQEQAAFEYGSFTPEVVGGSTNGVSTHSIQLGQYTKIGRWVHFSLYVIIAATTGVGELIIRGLPYVSDNAAVYYACTLAHTDLLAYTGTPSAYINPSTSYIIFKQSSPNTAIQNIPIDTNFGIMVSGSYKTASL